MMAGAVPLFWVLVAFAIPAVAAFNTRDFAAVLVTSTFVLFFGVLLVVDRSADDLSWALPLGLFVTLVIWIGLFWFSGRIFEDIQELIAGGSIQKKQIWWAGRWAALYSLLAVLVTWFSFDVAELYERRVMYGCEARAPSSLSYYGTTTDDDIFYGWQEGDTRFVSARTVEKPLLGWSLRLPDGPLLYPLSWTVWACPNLDVPLDHEKSAIATVDAVAAHMQAHLQTRVENAVNDAEEAGDQATQEVERRVFGDDANACFIPGGANARPERIALPGNGECVVGRLPRSCGLWRWVSRTGQCIERKVKKPTIRTYENWRDGFHQNFQDKLDAFDAAEADNKARLEKELKTFVEDEIVAYESQSKRAIRWSFLGWSLIGWIGTISAVSFVAKTFLTLFSRFLFSDEAKDTATLRLVDAERRQGLNPVVEEQIRPASLSVRDDGSGFRLVELDYPCNQRPWLVFDNAGVTWPKYGQSKILYRLEDAYLRRLRNGKVAVHHLSRMVDHETAVGRVRQDLEIVEFRLEEKQEVIVDLSKVLAFEGNIRFRSAFLPRLGAFFQQQLFYPVVRLEGEGSGRILLVGEGKAFGRIHANEPDGLVDPLSIGIMDLCGLYRGAASLKRMSPYYRPVTIGPAEPNTVMIASNMQVGAAVGLLARLKGFVWFLVPL